MAWIELHQSLRNHRKILLAAEQLAMDKHKLLGHVICLWLWGLDNADIDGNLPPGTSSKTVANASEISPKIADKFLRTMVETGFIENKSGQLMLHDWYEYAGKLNQKREANRNRMREARLSARADNVQRTNPARAGATVPNHTVPNHTNKENNKRNVYEIFEENYQKLTTETTNRLNDLITEYSEEKVERALQVGIDNNARKLSYIEKVLENGKNGNKQANKRDNPEHYTRPEELFITES